MKKTLFAAILISAWILFYPAGAKAEGIKEGQWSMTTVIQMEGMDDEAAEAIKEMENMSPEEKAMMQRMMGGMKFGMQGGEMGVSTTMTQCITNEDPVPESSNKNNCTQTHTIQGQTVHFQETCPDSHSTGQITYRNDSMKGTIHSTQTTNGKEENVTLDISGQYAGPCDQDKDDTSSLMDIPSAEGLSARELAVKQKELDLRSRELEIKQKELELQASAINGNNKPAAKSALNDLNNAVTTTNSVKNTIGGLRSLLGR